MKLFKSKSKKREHQKLDSRIFQFSRVYWNELKRKETEYGE